MKYMLSCVLLAVILSAGALEVIPFGPDADVLHCANLMIDPLSFGGMTDGVSYLYVEEDNIWNPYSHFSGTLPIRSICKVDDNTLLIAMGCGTYSDGIYNFDLTTHEWTINEWAYYPNFVLKCCANNIYYFGDQYGLYTSYDGIDWQGVPGMGSTECNSFSCFDQHIVVNNGSSVYCSNDCGQTWQLSPANMLKGFRFSTTGILYAILDEGTDSDGLWCSTDFGETWSVALYTTNLSSIGPDFGGYLSLGWSEYFAESAVGLLSPNHQLLYIVSPELNSPVKKLEIFPLVDTPSISVLNGDGFYYLCDFLPVGNDDQTIPHPRLKMEAFPNPSRGEIAIKIESSQAAPAQLSLYNLKGQRVKELGTFSLNQGDTNLSKHLNPGSSLPAGIYFLRLESPLVSQNLKLLLLE
ncbi:MAG: T9SS type A sorting domain-containing protein [Candidatus Cloacimonetes bacterium]|nr:T9SS type A sorting domain-containing protein [Candidatus Cloacimonadota bacterium]